MDSSYFIISLHAVQVHHDGRRIVTIGHAPSSVLDAVLCTLGGHEVVAKQNLTLPTVPAIQTVKL